MKSKMRYNKGFIKKAKYNIDAIQQNIKHHCNLPANGYNPDTLSTLINRVWISWIVDAVRNIVMAIK